MSNAKRFIGNYDLNQEEVIITSPEVLKKIKQVLRLRVGDYIKIVDQIKGDEAKGQLIKLTKEQAIIKINSPIKKSETTKPRITLYCAVLKKDNFELVVQKTTELGVSKIVPLITKHTIKQSLRLDRLEKIAQGASEQSGRKNIPEIISPSDFTEAVTLTCKDLHILFEPGGEGLLTWLKDYKQSKSNQNLSLWIGPEGGFSSIEKELMIGRGWKTLSLSSQVLRAETAAIVGMFIVSLVD